MANLDGWRALALSRAGQVPTDATTFVSANTTDITSTTAQTIKAAVASKAIYVTKLLLMNKTPAEAPVITIEDNTGTPVVHLGQLELSTAAGNEGFLELDFNPPIVLATGKALMGTSDGSTGDTIVCAYGFVGTPGTYMDGTMAAMFYECGYVDDTAVAMSGYNSTLITDTTAREIVAASASNSHYIKRIKVLNSTPAETPHILIQDGAGTPVNVAVATVCTAANNAGGLEMVFSPPIPVAVGEPVNGAAVGTTGDTVVVVSGLTY